MGGEATGYAPDGAGGADAGFARRGRKCATRDACIGGRLTCSIDSSIFCGPVPTHIDADVQGCDQRRAERDVFAVKQPAADRDTDEVARVPRE